MGWKTALILGCAGALAGMGATEITATPRSKPRTRAEIPKIKDKSHPVWVALEKNYARMAQAYYDDDPGTVAALRAPNFCWRAPDGSRATAAQAADYLRSGFNQVERTIYVSFTLDSLVVDGEKALVWMHRQWRRQQKTDDAVHLVETASVQCEWWQNTDDGWRIFFVDDVHPTCKIDGKPVDCSQSYDPTAVPCDP